MVALLFTSASPAVTANKKLGEKNFQMRRNSKFFFPFMTFFEKF